MVFCFCVDLNKIDFAAFNGAGGCPPLPEGSFTGIGNNVFIFKHKRAIGCRDTTSRNHSRLPGINMSTTKYPYPIPRQSLCGAGTSN